MGVVCRASLHTVCKGENPNAQEIRTRIICFAVYRERRLARRGINGVHGRTIATWYDVIFGWIIKCRARCRGGGGGRGSGRGKRGRSAGS